MKTRIWWMLIPLGLLLVLSLAASASADTKHVYGTNTYPQDPQNVQAALDAIQPGGTVVLHGLFNFGTWDWNTWSDVGSITISKPGVTLTGEGNAKIAGGGKFFEVPNLGYFIIVIHVEAPGVQVRNLDLEGSPDTGILMWMLSSSTADLPVTLKDNTVSAAWAPIVCFSTDCPAVFAGNTLKIPSSGFGFGILVSMHKGALQVVSNKIEGFFPGGGIYGLYLYQNDGSTQITDNTINASADSWAIYVTENGGPLSIKDNTINIEHSAYARGIHACWAYDVESVKGNTIRGAAISIETHDNGRLSNAGRVEIVGNSVEATRAADPSAWYGDIMSEYDAVPVSIRGNSVKAILDGPGVSLPPVHAGIWVFGYNYSGEPNSPDQTNPSVSIKENTLDMRFPFPGNKEATMGIWLGGGGVGIDNTKVEANRISGAAMAGIVKNEYGKRNLIQRNDLSGLKTWGSQVAVYSKETSVLDNKFGFANGIRGSSVAVELASMLQFEGLPMPLPTENCVIAGNDYRSTGLPGWSGGGSGCIHLFSYGDKGGIGTEVKNNLVAEVGMFPAGTGVQNQVLVENSSLVHDNLVVGLNGSTLAAANVSGRVSNITPLSSVNRVLEPTGGSVATCSQKNMAMLSKLGKKPKSDVAGKGSGTISIPHSVVLDQNYPNPFNPSTTIRYALPKDASIKLAVYDLLGREVARLYEGQMSAGYHEVVFNATNLASGVYVCRLQAGELVIAKKLSVMK